jgi:hypothetical protein
MKKILPLLFLALILSACGAETVSPTDQAAAVNAVYTSVAMTVSAQAAAATPTPEPTATSTLPAIPTMKPTDVVSQNVLAPVPVVKSGPICDNSAYISDVTIPYGTIFAPGANFTKTWKFMNTGTCAWSTSYSLIFVSGSALSGPTTALTADVNSGTQANAYIVMVASSTPGTYTGYWKLQNAGGTSFGESVYVQIVVSSSETAITSTPTATAGGSTSTSTAASSTESTSTPLTDTPTPTL